jgi:hypothetical protein
MEEKIKEWSRKRKLYKIKVEDIDKERFRKDPYYFMFASDKIEELVFANSPIMTHENKLRRQKRMIENSGRYPIGWRQYENFSNYKIMNPEA